MKFTVNGKTLSKQLSEMIPFAKVLKNEKDSPKTVILESISNDTLRLYTGDFKCKYYCERTVPIKLKEAGTVGIEIKQAIDALGVVENEVEIEIAPGQSGVIRSNKSTLPLRGSVDTIMELDLPEANWFQIDSTDRLVNAAITADKCRRQDDDLQYDINGLCLLPTERGVELVGMDGSHLIAVATMAENPCDNLVVCQPILAKALSCYNKAESINICITDHAIWLKQGHKLNVLGRLGGDSFMDYRKIIDPNPIELGILKKEDSTKIVNLVRRRILEPTQQGLIRLTGEDDNLIIYGRHQKYNYNSVIPGIKLPPVSCSAEGLVKMLALFSDDVALKYSEKEEHLYLQTTFQTAIIRLMEDFFP